MMGGEREWFVEASVDGSVPLTTTVRAPSREAAASKAREAIAKDAHARGHTYTPRDVDVVSVEPRDDGTSITGGL